MLKNPLAQKMSHYWGTRGVMWAEKLKYTAHMHKAAKMIPSHPYNQCTLRKMLKKITFKELNLQKTDDRAVIKMGHYRLAHICIQKILRRTPAVKYLC